MSIYSELLYLIIFGCTGSLLLYASFLKLQRAGATVCCSARTSHYSKLLLLQGTGPRCAGFSSCGTQAQMSMACEILASGPGIETVSPALAGGFPTTRPPGEPKLVFSKASDHLPLIQLGIKQNSTIVHITFKS